MEVKSPKFQNTFLQYAFPLPDVEINLNKSIVQNPWC